MDVAKLNELRKKVETAEECRKTIELLTRVRNTVRNLEFEPDGNFREAKPSFWIGVFERGCNEVIKDKTEHYNQLLGIEEQESKQPDYVLPCLVCGNIHVKNEAYHFEIDGIHKVCDSRKMCVIQEKFG